MDAVYLDVGPGRLKCPGAHVGLARPRVKSVDDVPFVCKETEPKV